MTKKSIDTAEDDESEQESDGKRNADARGSRIPTNQMSDHRPSGRTRMVLACSELAEE